MLNIAAPIERQIVKRAEAKGVTVDQYLEKLLDAEPIRIVKLGYATPVLQDDPTLQFLNAQIADAESAAPGEIIASDEEYRRIQRAMNETRRLNGERILFENIVL